MAAVIVARLMHRFLRSFHLAAEDD